MPNAEGSLKPERAAGLNSLALRTSNLALPTGRCGRRKSLRYASAEIKSYSRISGSGYRPRAGASDFGGGRNCFLHRPGRLGERGGDSLVHGKLSMFPVDTPFRTAHVTLNGMSIQQEGTERMAWNEVYVPPLQFIPNGRRQFHNYRLATFLSRLAVAVS